MYYSILDSMNLSKIDKHICIFRQIERFFLKMAVLRLLGFFMKYKVVFKKSETKFCCVSQSTSNKNGNYVLSSIDSLNNK